MTCCMPGGVRHLVLRPLGAVGLAAVALMLGLVLEAGWGPLTAGGEERAVTSSPPDGTPDRAADPKGAETVAPEAGRVSAAPVAPDSLVASGPALTVPKEVLTLLDQRKRYLDQREEALRVEAGRLTDLKRDLEELLDRYEASVKAYEAEERKKRDLQKANADQTRKKTEAETAAQQASLEAVTKIYEAMPAEEAAARIEKMPPHMAVKVLRSVKSKAAGAILAQVRPDKAAKLTEQLFNPTRKKSE